MRVQLMASARHAIDSRDASLLLMDMYVRTFTGTRGHRVSTIYGSTSSCYTAGVAVGFAQSTESPRKEGSCVDEAVLRHSIELALDISLAPTRLQGPLSPRPSSQKTFFFLFFFLL